MNLVKCWYNFTVSLTVPSAFLNSDGTQKTWNIPAGTHLVTFDDFIVSPGRGAGTECDITISSGLTARILRTDLIQLCESGSVVFHREA